MEAGLPTLSDAMEACHRIAAKSSANLVLKDFFSNSLILLPPLPSAGVTGMDRLIQCARSRVSTGTALLQGKGSSVELHPFVQLVTSSPSGTFLGCQYLKLEVSTLKGPLHLTILERFSTQFKEPIREA